MYEPSIEGVLDMVKDVNSEWNSKKKKGFGGKATQYFHKSSDMLYGHKALMKVLPESNEHVSVFTGAVNAVIKVIRDLQVHPLVWPSHR